MCILCICVYMYVVNYDGVDGMCAGGVKNEQSSWLLNLWGWVNPVKRWVIVPITHRIRESHSIRQDQKTERCHNEGSDE